jgi:hypothetical protein
MGYIFENRTAYGVGFAVVAADGRRIQLKEFPGAKLSRQGKAFAKEFLDGVEREIAAGTLTAETYALRFPSSPNILRLLSLGVNIQRPKPKIDIPTVAAFSLSELAKKRADNGKPGTIDQIEILRRSAKLNAAPADPLADLLVTEVTQLEAERYKERAIARGLTVDRTNRVLKYLIGLMLYEIPANPFKPVPRLKQPKRGDDEEEDPIHADPFLPKEIETLLKMDGKW